MKIYSQSDKTAVYHTGLYVIIPVYNCKAYLRAAVQSVLEQPYKEIEMILVDDGSTDGSSALCDALAEENGRIHVIHQANAGVSAARNAGMARVYALSGRDGATGQSYTAFLDADDFWCPGVLRADLLQEEQLLSDRMNAQELPDIIGFSTLNSNTKGNRFRVSNEYRGSYIGIPERGTAVKILSGVMGAHLYRTDFLKEFMLSFIEGCRADEDLIFRRQAMFCASSLHLKSEPLYIYRRNIDSASHNPAKEIEAQLSIPLGWVQVKDLSDRFDGISLQKQLAWKQICTVIAGSRTLMAIGRLIEFGRDPDEVLEAVRAAGLMPYLERLRPEEIADPQKQDLKLYREDWKRFVRTKRVRGKLLCCRRMALRILPFLNVLYERKRFPMDHV